MRRSTIAAVVALAAAGVYLVAGAQQAGTAKDSKAEVWVFLLDKTGKAADVKDVTATLEISPKDGDKKTIPMERMEGKSGVDVRPSDKELPKDPPKDPAKESGKDYRESSKPVTEGMMKDHKVCGQVKDLDPYYVELIVIPPDTWMEKHKGDVKKHGKGFAHQHAGSYFKADMDRVTISDKSGKWVNFTADVTFTIRGDKRTVKNFTYPEGLWKDAMSRLIDNEFKTLKDDLQAGRTDKVKAVSHKIRATIEALPPLAFKDDEDRQEWEKARRDCMDSCDRLEKATGKEATEWVDACQDKCEALRSEAKDARGVLTAD